MVFLGFFNKRRPNHFERPFFSILQFFNFSIFHAMQLVTPSAVAIADSTLMIV